MGSETPRVVRRMLISYLVSHPIQYQAPFFRRLARSELFDFEALFGSDFGLQPSHDPCFGQNVDFGIKLTGGYSFRFIPSLRRKPDIDSFLGLVSRSPTVFGSRRPDVLILHGWRTALMWQAAAAAKVLGIPYVMRAETPQFKTSVPARGVRYVRRVALRALLGGARGALVLGDANARFYGSLGLSGERLRRVPYFVDNDAVRAASSAGRKRRLEIRREFGVLPEGFLVIGVGKFLPRKRALDLVRLMPHCPPQVHLLWVGSGEQEPEVRAEIQKLGLQGRVHLAGFLPSARVWQLMGASDLLAVPSHNEPWGLVINEAVAAGLPVLASDECGASEELVAPGRTGEILPVGDASAWRRALIKWAGGNPFDAKEAEARADAHSIEAAAVGLEAAILGWQDGTRVRP